MLARPCRAGFDRLAVYLSHLTRVWWVFSEKAEASVVNVVRDSLNLNPPHSR